MPAIPFRSCFDKQVALWILRSLSPALGRERFFSAAAESGYRDDDLADFLRLPTPYEASSKAEILRQLDQLHAALESAGPRIGLPPRGKRNFDDLAKMLRLNPVEQRLLEYFASTGIHSRLNDSQRMNRALIDTDAARYFSKVLGLPRLAVNKALARDGKLVSSGLIRRGRNRAGIFEFFSQIVAAHLYDDTFDPAKILRTFGSFVPPTDLSADDFQHLQPGLPVIAAYLRKAIASSKRGVNLLFYGPPGTGKTQLSRLLGSLLGLSVFELSTEDSDGDPIQASARLNTLQTTQTIFRDSKVLRVFDEAEDIIKASSPHSRSEAESHKGWFNRMLETNRFPVVWISNSISNLDPAFARRFDLIVEVPIPPLGQRRRILESMLQDTVSPAMIGRLAEAENLAPAIAARSRDVLQCLGKAIPEAGRDAAFATLIGSTMKAQGHADPSRALVLPIHPATYDVSLLNTPENLSGIAARLREQPSARLCLYGPPGTGKTSFGHWIAREIGRPIHLKKASDLLSPFLGRTEENIATMFEQATAENAVLLIDEVDSFLQNREHAQRSWEVTQVNEMLTRIESFAGLLIASTNSLERLDAASLRRFDLKLHFDYLRPEQVRTLFASYRAHLQLPADDGGPLAFDHLGRCTPGDFAAVARCHRFRPFASAAEFLTALQRELSHRGGSARTIGFTP